MSKTRSQLRADAEALRDQTRRQCFHIHSLIAALDNATDPAIDRYGELASTGLERASDAMDRAEVGTVSATWALVGGGLTREQD
jgi:hypothetical protein